MSALPPPIQVLERREQTEQMGQMVQMEQMERRSLMGAVPLVVALGAMGTSTLTLRQTAFMDPRHQVGEWGIGAVRPVWSDQQASPTLIRTIREKSHQQGTGLQ